MILGEQTYTVTRPGPRSVVDGEVSYDSAEELSIKGSLQPVKGAELMMLEEGERSRASHKLYTTTELVIGDLVGVGEKQHRVMAVLDYTGHVLQHYKAILAGPGEDSL